MKILIIDDEINICISLKNILDDDGYTVRWVTSCQESLVLMKEWEPHLIILDVRLKNENGLDYLKKLREEDQDLPIVMISGHSGISEAVQAMKLGACDFLEKPLNLTKVKLTIKNTLDFYFLKNEYCRIKESFQDQYLMVGQSPNLLALIELCKKLAKTNSKVLIRGESGTGKELLAFALHNYSERRDKPFIKFNSAALPQELIESELFGHEKGAFTGAIRTSRGKIELAHQGTLFLDEIGDMSLSAQAKVLRVLQEGEIQRVGSSQVIKVDTRIIAATHKNLEQLIAQGLFRDDLYYRLNVVPLTCPPLRERISDIPILIHHFNQKFAQELKFPLKKYQPEVLEWFSNYTFPGNIRELKNIMERIYILVDHADITMEDISLFTYPSENHFATHDIKQFWLETKSLSQKKEEFEKHYLQTQLQKFQNNISKTAAALAMQQSNLSRKLKELGIKIIE